MIKGEENFDVQSATESDSSTDSTNPFNVYVEMVKKSTKNNGQAKFTQLNTRSSNQSTPQNTKAPNCQDLHFSQSSQNDSLKQQPVEFQDNQNKNAQSIIDLKNQFHANFNQINETREDIKYWSAKCQQFEIDLQVVEFQREESRQIQRQKLRDELSSIKNDLRALLAKNDNLNNEFQKRDQMIEKLKFQKDQIDSEIGEIKQDLQKLSQNEEEKIRCREQMEFQAVLGQIYYQADFNTLSLLAMKVQSEIQNQPIQEPNQKSTDQQ